MITNFENCIKYAEKGEFQKAFFLLDSDVETELIRLDSYSIAIIAKVYTENNFFDTGVVLYKELIKRKWNDEIVYNELGQLFYTLQEWDKSVSLFRKCLKINSSDADTWGLLAQCYFVQMKYTKMKQCLIKGLNCDPINNLCRNLEYYLEINNLCVEPCRVEEVQTRLN